MVPKVVSVLAAAESGRDPVLEDVARRLGAALATAGFSIAVYSSSEKYLDRSIVTGFLETVPTAKGQIVHVWHPQGATDSDFAEMHDPRYDGRFDPHSLPSDVWNVTYSMSMKAVDAMMVLGGGDFSLVAALWALDKTIPVTCVAHFGGGACEAWKVMNHQESLATPGEVDIMGRRWSPASSPGQLVETLVSQTKRAPKPRPSEPSSSADVLSIAFTLITAAWLVIAGVVARPASNIFYALILVGPLVAAMAGATLRQIWQPAAAARSFLRTCALGIGVGLLYAFFFSISQATSNQKAFDSDVAMSTSQAIILSATSLGLAYVAGFAVERTLEKIKTGALPKDLGTPQDLDGAT